MTLLGDYWWDRPEPIPSAALVNLLAEFGTSENAARQAIRRLYVRELLVRSRSGRTTAYVRPRSASEVTARRLTRAMQFGARYPSWDGEWTVVVFSVPERQRAARAQLRNGLRDLGFALLQEAVWVTPHDECESAAALLDSLKIESAHVVRGHVRPRAAGAKDFSDAYDLDGLAGRYEEFIADLGRPELTEHLADMRGTEALVLRTRLMSRWVLLRRADPDLPREVLPSDWPRDEARRIFLTIYDGLAEPARSRFAEIVAMEDESLASLAGFHLSSDGVQ